MQTHAMEKGSEKTFSPSHLFSDRRIAAALGLGFTSGIPFLLVYGTQSAWLSEAKVPIGTLGLLSELTLAYKFKFLWAPFLDRYDAPLFSRRLGRRRGWIVVSQIAVMLALAGIAFGDPEHWLAWTVVFSLALGFVGATQDMVIDGWRITVAPAERQALLSSWAEIGWRVGTFVAGAGALYLADAFGWRAAYLCMAAAMAPGVIAALLAPEPESDKTASHEHPGFIETVSAPIKELIARLAPMAVPILALVAGFRMPGYGSSAMAMPLFKSLHYSNADTATVTKLFGFWVALGGTFLAAYVVPRIGMMASLFVGTVFGSASHLSLAYLAAHGGHGGGAGWPFAGAGRIDNFAYAFRLHRSHPLHVPSRLDGARGEPIRASDLALRPAGQPAGGASGFAIERLGFEWFFVATSLIGVPVAVLAWYVWRAPEGR